MYTVSQAARLAGVSPHTVRYYDERGLLVGVSRDAAGYRVFDDEALAWLRLVVLLRACDVPFQDVEECVALMSEGEDNARRRMVILESFKHVLAGKMREMEEIVDLLECMIGRCASEMEAAE